MGTNRRRCRDARDPNGPGQDGSVGARALVWGVDIVGYARSSSDEQDRSCPQQINELEKEARTLGAHLPKAGLPREHNPERGVYADDGVSGWKFDPEERDGSLELLRFCEDHRRPRTAPGIVLIWALSRFGRFAGGAEEAIYWIHRLTRLGWKLRSVTQPGLDSDDDDRLMRVIRAALEAEKDTASSEEKSRGVARGKQDLITLGVWHGGMAPWGYERWAAAVDESARAVTQWVECLPGPKRNGNPDTFTVLRPGPRHDQVKEIFRLYAEGEGGSAISMEEIARRLNVRGEAPHKHGRGWYHTTIRKVITNEAYIGIQRDRAGAAHTALWQPLIDREVWVRAQARLSEGRIRGKGVNSVYLLSGLLHCAACGAAMHGDVTDGVTYYKAQRRIPGKERCEECRRRVRADVVEPAVLTVIPQIADHPVCRRRIEEEEEALRGGHLRSRDRAWEIDVALGECRAQITRLVGALGIGGAVAEGITARLNELNADILRLERERAVIASGTTGRSPAAERADEARSFAEVFARASHAERKTIVACFVARVDVDQDGGRVVIGVKRPALLAA